MEASDFTDNLKAPNFFYDLIVFMTPSLTLTIAILTGLGNYGFAYIAGTLGKIKIEGIDSFVLFIFFFFIFLFVAYEYGRLAEALSIWVGDLIRLFRKKGIMFLKEKDYNINFKPEIEKLNLHLSLKDDKMGKWTIYFYAMRFTPGIGNDILKRYAWEKLSRSSAFTYGIVFLASIFMVFIRALEIKSLFGYVFLNTGPFGFGSLVYTLSSFGLMVFTTYEYYRRKSWNNDLLVKVLPVITSEHPADKIKIPLGPESKATTESSGEVLAMPPVAASEVNKKQQEIVQTEQMPNIIVEGTETAVLNTVMPLPDNPVAPPSQESAKQELKDLQ